MSELDEYGLWLEWEQTRASEYHDEAIEENDEAARNYWNGYADAMTNALATYSGPTPIPFEEESY